MAGMIEVAQATVTIIPTMQGAQSTITKEMQSATSTAADKAGKTSGQKFSSTFGSGIKKGAKVIAGAVTAAVAGVGAMSTALYSAAAATAEYGDNIDKMSQKMGLSSDAYQEWDFIAQHSGTSMESLKNSMVKLSTAAANGSDAFEALGISADEAAGMSREELWNRTITALTGVKDETERARIAQDLFGKGATEMGALLNTSAEDIEAMRQQAHDLGIVMDEEDVKAAAAFQDSLQNLTQSFGGLKNGIISEFMPGITQVMDGLTEIFSGDSESGVAKIKEGIASISEKITEVMPTLIETGGQILTSIMDAITDNLPLLIPLAADILIKLADAIVTALPTILDAGVDILNELIKGIIDNGPELMKKATSVLTDFMTSMSEKLPDLLTTAAELVTMLVNGIIDNAPTLVTGAIEAIKNFVTGILDNLPDVLAKGGEIITTLISGITEHAPELITSISGAMGDILTVIGDVMADILEAIAPYIPDITDMVETTVEKLPDIISAFNDLMTTVSGALTDIIEAIAPYIPDITDMVETTVSKLPEIVSAFSDLFSQVGPIIESIASVIESVGTAIGTVVTAVGDAVATINESFAKVLDSLKGVIDSIGDSALKAGQGFSLLADAIIRLVGETGFFDLAATLTAVAAAVGDIAKTGKNAGDAYKNLEKLIETLTKLANTEFDQVETDLQSVADKLYVITIYTPTLKDTKTNLDDIGKVRLTTLNNDLDNANTKVGTFQTTVQNAFTSISSTISDKLNTISNDITGKLKTIAQTFTDQTASWKTTVSNAITAVKNLFGGGFDWNVPELKIPVKVPEIKVEGKWEFNDNGDITKVPKFKVEWYKRAAELGALFDSPTIIGVGDAAQPELLIGEDTLYDKIRQAVTENAGLNQTINITAPQGLDAAETARLVRNNSRQMLARMKGGV